jgi:hypothetical protein
MGSKNDSAMDEDEYPKSILESRVHATKTPPTQKTLAKGTKNDEPDVDEEGHYTHAYFEKSKQKYEELMRSLGKRSTSQNLGKNEEEKLGHDRASTVNTNKKDPKIKIQLTPAESSSGRIEMKTSEDRRDSTTRSDVNSPRDLHDCGGGGRVRASTRVKKSNTSI